MQRKAYLKKVALRCPFPKKSKDRKLMEIFVKKDIILKINRAILALNEVIQMKY